MVKCSFVLRIKFSSGRQFCASKSPTSCSCKPLAVILGRHPDTTMKGEMKSENINQYRLLNYGLLLAFIGVLLYPLVAQTVGLDVRTCNGHCSSCGMTRDIYNIMTFHTHGQLINPKSFAFFTLILSLIVSRIVIAQLIFYNLRNTAIGDIIFSTSIFTTIFFLINKL